MPPPSQVNPALGQRLREARSDAGLTQAALARSLGIKRASVSQWEQGVTQPTTERLIEVARITKRPLSWFLIEDATAAMHAAHDPGVADEILNAVRGLPDPLRALVERYIERTQAYARTLPSWMTATRVPGDEAARLRMLSEIEADMARRLPPDER